MPYDISDIFDPSSPHYSGAPNLTIPPSAQQSGTVGASAIGTSEQGSQLDAVANKLPEITVDSDTNIQLALDKLNQLGGGIVNLLAGIYKIASLTGYSSIEIRGVSPSATILDANSTSANLSFVGTNVYTTGTITSISGGVSVTGSGTSWLANVSAGQHLFLGTRWYEIAVVTSDTTLILSEGYGDNVTMPGAAYRIASVKQNITLRNLSIKNSTGIGLVATDCRKVTLDGVLFQSNNKGIVFTNVSEINNDKTLAVTNTSNGFECANVGLCDWSSVNSIANGGSGFVFNNVKTFTLFPGSATANTVDGFNFTTVVDLIVTPEASGNGGQGIEMVSGCSDIVINSGPIKGNASDGIKLTATSDQIKINNCDVQYNGSYGINVAASTDDNTIITGNTLIGNSSGQVNDSGTGTLIRGNIGVNDNSTSSLAQAGLFGDGSDGSATISVDTSLSSDKFYVDLTINNGITLTTNGYKIYCNGTLTNNGTIKNPGGNGVNGTNATNSTTPGTAGAAGAGAAGGSLPAGAVGVAGVNGTTGSPANGINGTAGANKNPALGGSGGVGGNGANVGGGTAVGGNGGAAGVATSENVNTMTSAYDSSGNLTSGVEKVLTQIIVASGSTSLTTLSSAASGGSGASGGTNGGASGGTGGSGGGGGWIFIAAKILINNGTITAAGGNGANAGTGSGTYGGSGGSAGGGGGIVFLIYQTLTAGTITVPGGTGGTASASSGVGGTAAVDGASGAVGNIYKVKLSMI